LASIEKPTISPRLLIVLQQPAIVAKAPGSVPIQFQKILDHRGVEGGDPISALAHLQLARAVALAGDKAKARAAYDHFLTLWKDADPGVPILKQARAEYLELD
jgi:hypothetical protein